MSKRKRMGRASAASSLITSAKTDSSVRAKFKIGTILTILVLAVVGFGAFLNRNSPTRIGVGSSAAAVPVSTPEYAADKPAKEYIYAGSKLVAVSESKNPAPVDLAVWRPSNGTWYIRNQNGTMTGAAFGAATDIPTPGDYDGDGKTDFCVYRPSDTSWYMLLSGSGESLAVYNFGASTDKPVPADFTGDGKTELALFRPSDGTWHLYDTTQGYLGSHQFGITTDIPVPGDYDGDGKVDMAVWRDSTTTFYVLQSSDTYWQVQQWGSSGDKPIPGDYDGDGKTDFAGWQSSGIWNIRRSSTGTTMNLMQWGYQSSDVAVQADYDADGKTDHAVWRPNEGRWYIYASKLGWYEVQWGLNGDKPVPGPFQR